MNNGLYDEIEETWARETRNEELQDLEDVRLSRMVAYLSKVRLSLAEAKDELHERLLSQEGQNLEFMLKDLLSLRRDKIIRAAMTLTKPEGLMTLPEEEFYNRLIRAFKGHYEFINDSLRGITHSTLSRPVDIEQGEYDEMEDIEYVTVRFIRATGIPAEGLDGRTYGPYEKEDLARMPASTALVWINQNIATRVISEDIFEE